MVLHTLIDKGLITGGGDDDGGASPLGVYGGLVGLGGLKGISAASKNLRSFQNLPYLFCFKMASSLDISSMKNEEIAKKVRYLFYKTV